MSIDETLDRVLRVQAELQAQLQELAASTEEQPCHTCHHMMELVCEYCKEEGELSHHGDECGCEFCQQKVRLGAAQTAAHYEEIPGVTGCREYWAEAQQTLGITT